MRVTRVSRMRNGRGRRGDRGVGGKEVRPAQRGKSAGQVKGNKNIKAEERGSEN